MICTVIGDSIAVGMAQQLPQCAALAHKGWTSRQWHSRYSQLTADGRVVISLGSNDFGIDTAAELRLIRRQFAHADRVIWIVPARQADAVRTVAAEFGDAMVSIPALGPDHIHPTGHAYRAMAKRIERTA